MRRSCLVDNGPITVTVKRQTTMAETCKTRESDAESTSGDSDYCPSNDSSYSESLALPKAPRRGRKRSAEEAESRTLMRQWLIDLIDKDSISGLYWMNDDKTLVHIPWLHASRHTFNTNKDSTLFMEWAIHTGKYVPDKTKPDPKRWKANFRCAINSLSDVNEEPTQSCKKGHNAYKVYRFDADKRLAKKRSCSSNGQMAVVNADRRELTRAKRMKRMKTDNKPAITKWLKQQHPDEYSDVFNDITVDEFGATSAEDGVSPVTEYEDAGLCGAGMILGREETVESCRDDYAPEHTNAAAIPLTVDEFSSPPNTYDTAMCQYSKEACGSPAGSDSHSVDSGLTDLTDTSIAEMLDEWQSETESGGKWFLQLTSVNISYAQGRDYGCDDTPTEVSQTQPL
ncbi:hypothetical protein LSAT2_018339 [Lamellibrachia satsuma]|nr:hypothetical protein LSAT2_018339 [Lamellibrachia satsuma]